MLAVWPAVLAGGLLAPVVLALAGVAVVVLAGGLALGFAPVVPLAVAVLAAPYVAVLAARDDPLAFGAALYAAGLLLAAELAYWSLELHAAVTEEPGGHLRRVARLLVLALGAAALGAALLALVDVARTGGLAVELVGAAAAAAALLLLLRTARRA